MKKLSTLILCAMLSISSIFAAGEWKATSGSLQEGDVVIFKDIATGFALGSADIATDYSSAAFVNFTTDNKDIQFVVSGDESGWTFTVKSTNGSENPFCLTKGNTSNNWTTQIGTSANDTWTLTESTSGQYQLSNSNNSGKFLGTDESTIGSYLYRDKSAAINWNIYKQSIDTVVVNGEYFKVLNDNLIPNGNFNDTLKYWTAGDGSDLSLDKFSYSSTGGAIDDCAYITSSVHNSASGAGSIKTCWNIDTTKTYLFRYYVKYNKDATAGSSEYLRVSTTKIKGTETNPIDSGAWNANNEWTLNAVSFNTAETGDTLLMIGFRWLGIGDFSFDEFSLVEVERMAKIDISSLSNLIDSANVYAAKDGFSEGAKTELNTAIADATAAADTIERTNELKAALATLQTAINFYKLSPATTDSPIDATFIITNPSFETGNMTGWTASKGGDVGAKENANGTYNMTPCDGDYLFNTWTDGTADNSLAQTIAVPNGNYTLTAWVASDKGNVITLYANAFELACPADTLGKAASKEYTLNDILVTGKSITIGTKSSQWYKADHFRLTYSGKGDENAAKKYLQAQLDSIKALDLTLSPNGVDAVVTAAITTGETAVSGSDEDAIGAAVTKIGDAITLYHASLTDYAYLKTAIDSATYLVTNTDYNGKAALQLALDTAKLVYNADTTLTKHLNPATAKLKTAIVAYNLNKPATKDDPVDYTTFITDPSFELSNGKTLGGNWKLNNVSSGGDFRTNSNKYNIPDGVNFWNSWSNNFTSMEIYQDIANLPNGEYKVTCYAITQRNADGTSYRNDQHLYATSYETVSDTLAEGYDGFAVTGENVWDLLEVTFYVTTGNVRIGFASTFPTGATYGQTGWWCIDDFHLYYYGPNQDAVYQTYTNLIATIKSERDEYAVPMGEDLVLTAAIEEAETFLTGTYTSDELDSMLTVTTSAWNYFKASQDIALELDAYIIEATEIYETADKTVYPQTAFDSLNIAIGIASDILGADTALTADCEIALAELKTAVKIFKYTAVGSEENPADFTFAIVNAALNITSNAIPDGWTASHENGNGYTGSSQHYLGSGHIYFDAWNGTAGLLKYNAHQDIADLPAGEYTFSMAGRSTNAGDDSGNDGVQIYAYTKVADDLFSNSVPIEGDGNVTNTDAIPSDLETALFNEDGVTWYGWNSVTVPHILLFKGDTLQVGIDVGYYGTFTGTWFSGAAPELYYLGKTQLFTGLQDASATALSAYVLNKRIMVEGTTQEVSVYNIAGIRVRNENLTEGIYLVRAENKTFKVVVR